MSDTLRDTQFAGFAHALLCEMLTANQQSDMLGYLDFNADDTEDVARYTTTIARRAYDLVTHVLHITDDPSKVMRPQQIVERIPDMTEFPKEA